jgi:hypothetical protein
MLEAEPQGTILPVSVAAADREAEVSSVERAEGDWSYARRIVGGLRPEERGFAGLILGNDY